MLVSRLGVMPTVSGSVPSRLGRSPLSPAPILFAARKLEGEESGTWTKNPLLALFLALTAIVTPNKNANPAHADAIEERHVAFRALLTSHLNEAGVTDITTLSNGLMLARVPASTGLEKADPLLIATHYDIVSAKPTEPLMEIRPELEEADDGRVWIQSDGKTTLGADNKNGVAMTLHAIKALKDKPHGPLEILFQPDEENGNDTIKTLNPTELSLRSQMVLIPDGFDAATVETGSASSDTIDIEIKGLRGGHSGLDILDGQFLDGSPKSRLSALQVMLILLFRLPQGVISMNPAIPGAVQTSINWGKVEGGTASNAIASTLKLTGLLRSSNPSEQAEQLQKITELCSIVQAELRQQCPEEPGLEIAVTVKPSLPAWQNDPKSPTAALAVAAASKTGIAALANPKVGPIHAGTPAAVLAQKQNVQGDQFVPILFGPHIKDAHSVSEKMDVQTFFDAAAWLEAMISAHAHNEAARLATV